MISNGGSTVYPFVFLEYEIIFIFPLYVFHILIVFEQVTVPCNFQSMTIFKQHPLLFQWNDVILAFRQYLPCGRHRRYMKTFDNCFSGASATEWLLQYLKTNGNFGSDISRYSRMLLPWCLSSLKQV